MSARREPMSSPPLPCCSMKKGTNRLKQRSFIFLSTPSGQVFWEISYMRLGVLQPLIQLFLDGMYQGLDEIGKSEYFVSMLLSALAEEVGLVTYSGGVHMGAFSLENIIMAKLINLFFGGVVRCRCSQKMVPRLMEIIMDGEDSRLGVSDLYSVARELTDDQEGLARERSLLVDDQLLTPLHEQVVRLRLIVVLLKLDMLERGER